jgi:hypothetical protein
MLDLSQATDQSFNDEKPRMMMRIVSLFLVFFIATADIIADPGGDLSCLIACCEEDCSGLDTSYFAGKCFYDPLSTGWIAVYSDSYEFVCVLRDCCEEAYCGPEAL